MDWKMRTANLIKDVGVDRLGTFDGCLCTHFAVQNVRVDVSCRKSPSGNPDGQFYGVLARVHSASLDVSGEVLENVAREVIAQLEERYEGGAFMVRYCGYKEDAAHKCVYCGNPRSDHMGYLCDVCPVWWSRLTKNGYRFRRGLAL